MAGLDPVTRPVQRVADAPHLAQGANGRHDDRTPVDDQVDRTARDEFPHRDGIRDLDLVAGIHHLPEDLGENHGPGTAAESAVQRPEPVVVARVAQSTAQPRVELKTLGSTQTHEVVQPHGPIPRGQAHVERGAATVHDHAERGRVAPVDRLADPDGTVTVRRQLHPAGTEPANHGQASVDRSIPEQGHGRGLNFAGDLPHLLGPLNAGAEREAGGRELLAEEPDGRTIVGGLELEGLFVDENAHA